MAIFNLYSRKYLAIRKPQVMRPRLLLTINWKFAVDFFARGLHTRTAVAHLPLRPLGFLVLKYSCSVLRTALPVVLSNVVLHGCPTVPITPREGKIWGLDWGSGPQSKFALKIAGKPLPIAELLLE